MLDLAVLSSKTTLCALYLPMTMEARPPSLCVLVTGGAAVDRKGWELGRKDGRERGREGGEGDQGGREGREIIIRELVTEFNVARSRNHVCAEND